MRVGDKHMRPIWEEGGEVRIIDQTRLPFDFVTIALPDEAAAARAIARICSTGSATSSRGASRAAPAQSSTALSRSQAESLSAVSKVAANVHPGGKQVTYASS